MSEGTLTPDINEMQYHDLLDGETSSVYSCDTEGLCFHFRLNRELSKKRERGKKRKKTWNLSFQVITRLFTWIRV